MRNEGIMLAHVRMSPVTMLPMPANKAVRLGAPSSDGRRGPLFTLRRFEASAYSNRIWSSVSGNIARKDGVDANIKFFALIII